MSRQRDLAARASQLAGRTGNKPAAGTPVVDEPQPAPQRPPVPRAKPIKLSTEVSPNRHRFLTGFVRDVADQAGRARVAHSEVMRALLDELEGDPTLQSRVSAKLVEQLRD